MSSNVALEKLAKELRNLNQLPTKVTFGVVPDAYGESVPAGISGSTLDWDSSLEPATASDVANVIYHELLHNYFDATFFPGANGAPTSVVANLYNAQGVQDLSVTIDLTQQFQLTAYQHLLIHNLELSAFSGTESSSVGEAIRDLQKEGKISGLQDYQLLAGNNADHVVGLSYTAAAPPAPMGACE